MRDRNRAVQQAVPTPVTTVKHADDDPDMLPISDDDSVESSLYSQDSESEGGIWDNQYNDDVSIAPEGAQLIPPDNDGNKAPLVGSAVGRNIGPEHEDVLPPILFWLRYKLLRELPVDDVGNSTLQPYGNVVLMAKWREL
jgi:hypothetical protein